MAQMAVLHPCAGPFQRLALQAGFHRIVSCLKREDRKLWTLLGMFILSFNHLIAKGPDTVSSAIKFEKSQLCYGSVALVSVLQSRWRRRWHLCRLATRKAKRGFQVDPPKVRNVEVLEAEVEAEVIEDRRVVLPEDTDAVDPEVLSDDMSELEEAAEGGDVGAMFRFGKALLQGWDGQEANKAKGSQWLLRSAEQGHRPAQSAVGEMFYTGLGLPQNKEEAYKWLKRAAAPPVPEAQFNLGVMLQTGDGVPMDKKKAYKYYLAAARAGVARAMNNIGYMLRFGDGIEENKEEALEWYLQAAKTGDMDAQYHLGATQQE